VGPCRLSSLEECRDFDLSDGRGISIRREKKYCQEGEQREARWGFDRGSAGWIKICGWDETGRNSVIGWLHLDNRMEASEALDDWGRGT
jgi:hypothetical protein